MKYPSSIQNLIDMFSMLPTVGPKTAERYVFYLLKQNPEDLQKFAQYLAELKEKTTICQKCLAISETDPCLICVDNKRDHGLICVVANTQDVLTIEATKQYNGLYHVLGGVINAIEGIKPEQLNIKPLLNRVKNLPTAPLSRDVRSGRGAGGEGEVILALNPNLEGETTSMYLAKLLKPYKLRVTRLAKGLPMGADLEYADEITLANALKYRTDL